mgnify:CR=1 FL=1
MLYQKTHLHSIPNSYAKQKSVSNQLEKVKILEIFIDEYITIHYDENDNIGKPIIIKSDNFDIISLLTTFTGLE